MSSWKRQDLFKGLSDQLPAAFNNMLCLRPVSGLPILILPLPLPVSTGQKVA